MKVRHQGRREAFPLRTPNKATAAAKAGISIFIYWGWATTLECYKSRQVVLEEEAETGNFTVGEFLAELKVKADAKPKTLEGYAVALRKIVAEIICRSHGRGGGSKRREAWKREVESVKLASLTPATMQKWKLEFVAKAGSDPLKQRAARISASSFLRRARSLFAAK